MSSARDEMAGIWHEAQERARPQPKAALPPLATPSAQQVHFAWYAGLTVMAAAELIEWPLAAVLAAAHTVERYGHRRRFQEFVEGLDAGL